MVVCTSSLNYVTEQDISKSDKTNNSATFFVRSTPLIQQSAGTRLAQCIGRLDSNVVFVPLETNGRADGDQKKESFPKKMTFSQKQFWFLINVQKTNYINQDYLHKFM